MASIAMSRPFFLTSVGKKYLMALSGIIWAGFVMGHMAGNLLMFVGPDAYNIYGHGIVSGSMIYVIEGLLITALLVHVFCAVSLTLENRRARGQRYAVTPNGSKAPAFGSATMAFHGTIILVFIITHLATFKFGTYYETTVDGVVMRDLYRLMVEVFQQPGYLFWYFVSLALLAVHLKHGIYSIFQSLGIKSNRTEELAKKLGIVYSAVVTLGFLAQPIYIYLIAK